MNLERLAIALRPRNGWEAIDLGIRLALRAARQIYPAWLLFAGVLSLLLFGLAWALDIETVWPFLLLWWLRPLSDRVILHQVSHLVFGEAPGLRASFSALPRLILRSGLAGDLLWRRIDLRRGLRMPVVVLEGLRSKPARQRRTLLTRRVSGAGIWLTVGFSWLETVFCLGGIALIFMLLPESMRADFNFRALMFGEWRWLDVVASGLFIAAHLFIEPLYVAASFMLYLKRRNDLEAWDIELQFRRIAQARETAQTSAARGLMVTLLLGCALLPGWPAGPAQAQAQTPTQTVVDKARETRIQQAPATAREVLKDPVFGNEETRHEWRWRPFDFKGPDVDAPDWLTQWSEGMGRFIKAFARFLAASGRIVGWALLAVVIVVLLVVIARELRRRQRGGRSFTPLAELAGFDIRPESLPDDVAAAARSLLQAGRAREALSLLFRGALSALSWRDHVPFAPGDTEGDCLDRVHQHAAHCFAPLARLLAGWQTLAYAHREVEAAALEQLCAEWPRHFARNAGARQTA